MHMIIGALSVVSVVGMFVAYCIVKTGDITNLSNKNDFGPKKLETPMADFYVNGKPVTMGQLEAGHFHRKFTAKQRLDIIDNPNKDRYNAFGSNSTNL